MITVSIFVCIAVIAFVLMLYSLIDCDSPIWGNVFASGISIFMFLSLALAISSGGVVLDSMPVAVLNQTVLNSTDLNVTSITVYQNQAITTQVIDEGLSWLFAFICGINCLLFGYMILRIFMKPEEENNGYEEYVEIGDDY